MSSDVDICNLALSHLGDAATVASIDPPEGSAQAEHCALYFPIVRDALLEMHDWGFATKRAVLAQLTNPITQWAYCYAAPNNLIRAIAVLDSAGTSDTSDGIPAAGSWGDASVMLLGSYTPQPFVRETADSGADVIYTDQESAMLRYVARVTDTSRFSPAFVDLFTCALAAALAGPIIKGQAGEAAAARWTMIAFGRDGKSGKFGQAAGSDAGQRNSATRDRHQVTWLNAR